MVSGHVAVMGVGAWGTALCLVLARGGSQVIAWSFENSVFHDMQWEKKNSKYLPGIAIPDAVSVTQEAGEALREADHVVWAVPTRFLREVAVGAEAQVPPRATLISVAKGLELETGLRPSQVLEECIPQRPVSALLGPSHAEEVARGVPTSVVACSGDEDVAHRVQSLFHGPAFRVYRNDDLIGAELGGALKNTIALAAGISDGLGFGDNTKGALLTRGLAEMSRLGEQQGGRRETFFGLTGVGDLVTTAFSRYSRNRHVGEQLGRGRSLEETLAEMTQIAEGVPTSRAALELARENQVDVPIIEQIVSILYEGKSPRDALTDLMTRDPRQE